MKTHACYQSEISLKTTVDVYLKTRRESYKAAAYEAQAELARRQYLGGCTCDGCHGRGWFKDVGLFGGDEMCPDCQGTGTIISERELKHA